MTVTEEKKKTGLEDVIAGESKICLIDGDVKKLYYRGYSVADLVQQNCTFEEVCFLLLKGKLPNTQELEHFKNELNKARLIPSQILAMIALVPQKTHPMDMLRSIVSSLSQHDEEHYDNSEEANFHKATRLLAQTPVIVASYHRLRHGLQPIPPIKKLGLAGNFLYMLTGEEPADFEVNIFDHCLTLHADHGFNASTFTARVVAATLSDMHSAATAAIGALKGPLHGGANQEVMEMLKTIDDEANVESFVQKSLAEGKKISGFGHRVYRNCEDPRATILREASKELSQREGNMKWFNISQKLSEYLVNYTESKGKPIYPNVDFFSASTYTLLKIPTDLFTPIFAMSRMAGWCAHVMEQHSNNRLIRPMEDYIGERDLAYIPLKDRK